MDPLTQALRVSNFLEYFAILKSSDHPMIKPDSWIFFYTSRNTWIGRNPGVTLFSKFSKVIFKWWWTIKGKVSSHAHNIFELDSSKINSHLSFRQLKKNCKPILGTIMVAAGISSLGLLKLPIHRFRKFW